MESHNFFYLATSISLIVLAFVNLLFLSFFLGLMIKIAKLVSKGNVFMNVGEEVLCEIDNMIKNISRFFNIWR